MGEKTNKKILIMAINEILFSSSCGQNELEISFISFLISTFSYMRFNFF